MPRYHVIRKKLLRDPGWRGDVEPSLQPTTTTHLSRKTLLSDTPQCLQEYVVVRPLMMRKLARKLVCSQTWQRSTSTFETKRHYTSRKPVSKHWQTTSLRRTVPLPTAKDPLLKATSLLRRPPRRLCTRGLPERNHNSRPKTNLDPQHPLLTCVRGRYPEA